MTQAEAKELIHILLLCVQKAKSNISEAMAGTGKELDDTDKTALELINKYLFGKDGVDLVTVMLKLEDKEVIEPIDMYNALYICWREPTVNVCYYLWKRKDMPQPLEAMLSMMEANNVHS